MLSELHTQHGLSAATESFVLTGGSAGGMATLLNADYVRGLVTDIAPAAKYVAVPDSGYFMDGKSSQVHAALFAGSPWVSRLATTLLHSHARGHVLRAVGVRVRLRRGLRAAPRR